MASEINLTRIGELRGEGQAQANGLSTKEARFSSAVEILQPTAAVEVLLRDHLHSDEPSWRLAGTISGPNRRSESVRIS